jgi:uncharacterized protein YbcI
MTDHPGAGQKLTGGALLAQISENFVRLLREHYGRGPVMAKTYAIDDMIVCVLRDSGFTPLERTIMKGGEPTRVVAMREDFQRLMEEEYTAMIEQLTGRRVVAFVSQARVDPDITVEMFFLDAPLDVAAAVVAN